MYRETIRRHRLVDYIKSFTSSLRPPAEAAVGKIAMNFADLEQVTDRELRYLEELRLGHPVVDSAAITFSQKIWRIGISVAEMKGVLRFNRGSS